MLSRLLILVISTFALNAITAQAMPLYFLFTPSGNERDVEWNRFNSKRFSVYHDAKASDEGRYVIDGLEHAYPYLSHILGVRIGADADGASERDHVSRFDRIPVVVSTRADGGGFANFATQNVELQIESGGHASLFQHELVHRLMYELYDPYMGPAGRAATLLVLPTWWIEGLAEYLTESIGRIETRGVARSLALNDRFVSYDNLHSLYQDSPFITEGYVTSNRFLAYIFDTMKEKDLSRVNHEFFKTILTPPFINAPDSYLEDAVGMDGRDFYEKYKQHERDYWKDYLQGMPSIKNASTEAYFSSTGRPHFSISNSSVFVSLLAKKTEKSAFLKASTTSNEKKRIPLSVGGSSLFDLEPRSDARRLWTATGKHLMNHTLGFQLRYIELTNSLGGSEDTGVSHVTDIRLSDEDTPVDIFEIYALPQKKALIVGTTRAQWSVYLADAAQEKVTKLKTWPVPVRPRLVRRHSFQLYETENCFTVLLDSDREHTSMEDVCANDGNVVSKEVLKKDRIDAIDAVQMNDGSYIILGAWDNVQGLFRFFHGELTPIAPLREWVGAIAPWDGENSIAAWVYNGAEFTLQGIRLDKIASDYETWKTTLPATSLWSHYPGYQKYIAPYEKIAGIVPQDEDNKVTEQKIVDEPASYRHHHFFTYPSVLGPPVGPWTLGIVSYPIQDEMERYKVFATANYDFESKALSGTVTYDNLRILDKFEVNLFSRERFNGLYYLTPNSEKKSYKFSPVYTPGADKTGVNYLRESGLDLAIGRNYPQWNLSWSGGLTLVKLSPLYDSLYTPAPENVGAQNTLLASLTSGVDYTLLSRSFYMAKASSTNGNFMDWSLSTSLAFTENAGVGTAKTASGKRTTPPHFQEYSAKLSSFLGYDGHSLSLSTEVNTTRGTHSLNLREYYQPYRTYLPGTSAGLNAMNISLYGKSNIFKMRTGYWNYRNMVDYIFPLWSNINKKFFVLFFQSIRGEAVYSYGGVGTDANFKTRYSVQSASAAARVDIDIKGFKVFPSIAYGRVIGEPGWNLFCEVAFTQLL